MSQMWYEQRAVGRDRTSRCGRRSTKAIRGYLAVLSCCVPLFGGTVQAQENAGGWIDAVADWFDRTSEGDTVTPSHVFRATRDLVAEIEILRRELGADDYPPEAELQEDRAPVHVYAKTLEVMSKVARMQQRWGVSPAQIGQIPIKEVQPADVLASVAAIIGELRAVKAQMAITEEIAAAPFETGKTPSMVYKNLSDASFLLDGLAGRSLTPNDVYLNVEYILDELELIAARLRAPLAREAPPVEGRKTPKDVAQQVLRASYKIVNLQTQLGMDASSVPTVTLVRVTPSVVYDATNMLLAEMTRIKHHLDINIPRETRPIPRNKVPTDVFRQVLLVIANLDSMSEAVDA
ncbi:MAG: hypothetical protein OXG82_08375 [Gammaproteobacteria bacterium]|nr:hypothetical protein [Gammaproteobacteria bacterium]